MTGQSPNFSRTAALASVQPPCANRTVQPALASPPPGTNSTATSLGCCESWARVNVWASRCPGSQTVTSPQSSAPISLWLAYTHRGGVVAHGGVSVALSPSDRPQHQPQHFDAVEVPAACHRDDEVEPRIDRDHLPRVPLRQEALVRARVDPPEVAVGIATGDGDLRRRRFANPSREDDLPSMPPAAPEVELAELEEVARAKMEACAPDRASLPVRRPAPGRMPSGPNSSRLASTATGVPVALVRTADRRCAEPLSYEKVVPGSLERGRFSNVRTQSSEAAIDVSR